MQSCENLTRSVLVLTSFVVGSSVVWLLGQSPDQVLTFEVASVKQNRTETPATTLFPLGPGDAYAANGGRFRATNQPLITYLRFAYRLGPGDLLDLPRWIYNERFDVEARAKPMERTEATHTLTQLRFYVR